MEHSHKEIQMTTAEAICAAAVIIAAIIGITAYNIHQLDVEAAKVKAVQP